MDSTIKKRKPDENGTAIANAAECIVLTTEDVRKIIEPFTQDTLLDILQDAASRHPDVLDSVRAVADRDPAHRKLFVRGLGWDTYTEVLKTTFSVYGEIQEAIVVIDKSTGKSKGYGFVTFKHVDAAVLALKQPSKKIDGRMTVTTLASAGNIGNASATSPSVELSTRKIYVANVPADIAPERLLAHFSSYGEIEEGPLGFDKSTGKSKGYALFVYRTAEAARAALVDPIKNVDGHYMSCKMANEGKKKPLGQMGQSELVGTGTGMQLPSALPNWLAPQYAAPGAAGGFGIGMPAGHGGWPLSRLQESYLASTLIPSLGASGLSAVANQVPSATGAVGGFGAGVVNPYGGLADIPTSAYTGLGPPSLYRLPAASARFPSSGYPGSGHYGLPSSSFQGPIHQRAPSSDAPRVTSGSSYLTLPPYY